MKTGIDSYVCDVAAKDFSWRHALDQLRRDGAIVLRNLVDPKTVDFVVDRAKWFLARPSLLGSIGYYRKNYATRFCDPLLFGGPTVDVVTNMNVIDLITEYVGGECYLAEFNLKHDDGINEVYFPLHSDFMPGWTLKNDPTNPVLTAQDLLSPFAVGGAFYLHDTVEGAFCYALGTHTWGAPHGSNVAKYPAELRAKIMESLVRIEGKKGDMILFDDRGFHGPHQPTPASRTVFLFDYYKRDVFKGRTKTPIPMLLPDLGHLNERQLSWLGLGAGVMIPFHEYHVRQFSRTRHFPRLSRVSEAMFALQLKGTRLKGKVAKMIGRRRASAEYSDA
jgi:hypothetical protein